MSAKVTRLCEKCGAEVEHWDNRVNKKNPKSPDFKCCTCGEATWLPKEKKVAAKPISAPVAAHPAPVSSHTNGDQVKKEMLMSYCKDVVVAEISSGAQILEPFKRVADGFKVLMVAYSHPFDAPKVVKTVEAPKTIKEMFNEEVAVEESPF